MKHKKIFITVCFILVFGEFIFAKKVDLTIGLLKAGGQQYFIDLLNQSLKRDGHELKINILGNLPQKRLFKMFEANQLSLMWLMRSNQRDKKYIAVEANLTNNLIGHRILLISPKNQKHYNNVKNLNDFRNLQKIGAMGKAGFNVAVWKLNDLKYIERDGDWRNKIYKQVAIGNRGVDYFPRGANEILEEANAHPYVAIEKRLLFIYDRDCRFYLSKKASKYKNILEKSINKSIKNGLMNHLIGKHWPTIFSDLKFDNRVHIHLKTPK